MIVVGLGGNVGTPEVIERRFTAVARLLTAAGAFDLRASRLYRSAPVGPITNQSDFFNAALGLRLPPLSDPSRWLLDLWRIERSLGRTRPTRPRRGPRRIDLDILVWGERQVKTVLLEIPHPELARRAFALRPLADVVGEAFRVPGHGRLDDLLAAVAAQPCVVAGELVLR